MLASLWLATAWALPLPIGNGVLTGPLNANGQAISNLNSVTFADGTTLSTATGAVGGGSGTALPGNAVTNGQANVWVGSGLTVSNAAATWAQLNFGGGLGNVSDYIQANPVGLTIGNAAGAILVNGGTLTANAINLNLGGQLTAITGGTITTKAVSLSGGGSYTGNGAGLTNTPSSIVTSGSPGVTVAASTNAATGQITYAVAAPGSAGSSGSAQWTAAGNTIYPSAQLWTVSGNTIYPSGAAGIAGGFVSNGNQIYPQ